MALNVEEHHPAHSVSDYFEVLKMRYPSLFLLRDELEKPDIKEVVQRESAEIKGPKGRGKQDHLIASKDNKAK